MPYVLAINEKSALEGINLKEAAYNMMQDFREYRNLMTLRRTIGNAEKKLSALGKTIRQNQQAITTLMKLQAMGYTRKDIKELVALVSVWNKGSGISISNRKLDTELIDVGTQAQRKNVRKLDANNYSTSMTELKYKLAHKRAEKENWNISDNSQRKRLIQLLQELIDQLKNEIIVGSN